MSLIVIETSSTKVAVIQSSLQEIPSINLMPCVFYLEEKKKKRELKNTVLNSV